MDCIDVVTCLTGISEEGCPWTVGCGMNPPCGGMGKLPIPGIYVHDYR